MFVYSFRRQKYVVSPEIKAMTQFKIKLIMEYWKTREEQEAPR
jgi:hypothetical protein